MPSIYEIADWRIQVDEAATDTLYQRLPSLGVSCPCLVCRDFLRALPALHTDARRQLVQLGIDLRKPFELTLIEETENGTLLYSGIYPLIGKLLTGEDSRCYFPDGVDYLQLSPLTEDLDLGFSRDASSLPDTLPTPLLLLDFLMELPGNAGE